MTTAAKWTIPGLVFKRYRPMSLAELDLLYKTETIVYNKGKKVY